MSLPSPSDVSEVLGDLPRFAMPPVEEVSLAAHFQPLDGLRTVHIGRIAETWASDYPEIEELPPAPLVPDELGSGPLLSSGMQVELFDVAPLPRIWFLSPDKTLVRQLQRDRIVQNWRRVAPEDDYPHYDQLRPLFTQGFSDVEAFAMSALGADLQTTQCEVSYTNPIRVGGPFTNVGELEGVLAPWSGKFSDDFLSRPDNVTVSARFPMADEDGALVGRLHVSAQPAIHAPTGDQVLLLQLVARGRPLGRGLEGVLRFLDVGHRFIVRGFKSITTPGMHAEWRIQ